MRRSVWLALVSSVAVSAWVLLSPTPSSTPLSGVVAAREQAGAAGRAVLAGPQALAARWDAPMLEAARRNPFGTDAPPQVDKAALAPAPVPKLVVAQPAPMAAAPAPAVVPMFGYRYLGRLVDPLGQRVLYVARGDLVVIVEAGMQLNDGYTVDAVTESSIEFVNTATQQRHTIAIPPDANTTASTKTTP